ncbi:MAG: DUF2163 domain-containing protein [Aestuariivirga sp.]
MRVLPAGLAEHLASGATTLCHCWKLMPVNGAALGFTDHDRDVIFDGVTFEAQAGFEASEIESSLGLSVDNLEASGALNSSQLDAERLRAGDFDHATIEIWRVNWQAVAQRVLLRKGHLGEVNHGSVGFTAEVRGLSHLLNQTRGRVFQYGCDANLGDGRCTVDLEVAAFRGTGSIVTAEDNRRFTVAGLNGFAAGWFSLGTLTWSTGLNAGRLEEVKLHGPQGVIELWQAASFAVNPGDGFTIRAGCDKQFATCKAKFSNGTNFRGHPHLPGTDFVTTFASREGQNNDGGSRNSE